MRDDKLPDIRIPPFLWYLVFFVIGFALDRLWPILLVPAPLDTYIGYSIVGLGFVLLGLAEREFSRHHTTHDHRKPTTAIITTGPFRFTRNPVYVGLVTLSGGLAITLNSVWLLFTNVPAWLVMHFHVVPKEEAYLEEMFGDEFTAYAMSVRRWL